MPRPPLTVTIIALNEARNIGAAIASAGWADEVLVVDSGSVDGTPEIARGLGARVVHNAWPGYGQQKNFAQREAAHDWVLNLDADETVPPELAREIEGALSAIGEGRSATQGFYVPRKTLYLGRWIRHGGWYPNHLVRLADRRAAAWTEPHVHEALEVRGPVAHLAHALHHDAFPTIADQVRTNLRFATLGAEDLRRRGQRPSVPRLILKPIGKFIETYVLKHGFLDGLAGFVICVNAAYSLFLKYAFLLEPRLTQAGYRGADHANPDHR